MSKGPRPANIVAVRAPVVLAVGGPDQPCAAARRIEFVPEVAATIGSPVHIVPAQGQLWVVAATTRIGTVTPNSTPELAACIREGWAFSGMVESIEGDVVAAVVEGHPTR